MTEDLNVNDYLDSVADSSLSESSLMNALEGIDDDMTGVFADPDEDADNYPGDADIVEVEHDTESLESLLAPD